MNREEKKAIEELEEFIKGPCETCKYCEGAYKLNRKNIIQLLNLTKKLQKENKDLKEIEEENKFLRNQELGYIAGYEDGKKHKMTAVAMRIENMKYELYESHIKALKKRIEYLLSIEEHRKENYIPVSLVEKKIEELNRKEQELQNSISDEEREEYSDANIRFELMDIEIRRRVLQELLERRTNL